MVGFLFQLLTALGEYDHNTKNIIKREHIMNIHLKSLAILMAIFLLHMPDAQARRYSRIEEPYSRGEEPYSRKERSQTRGIEKAQKQMKLLTREAADIIEALDSSMRSLRDIGICMNLMDKAIKEIDEISYQIPNDREIQKIVIMKAKYVKEVRTKFDEFASLFRTEEPELKKYR
jgi:hypothetical protein